MGNTRKTCAAALLALMFGASLSGCTKGPRVAPNELNVVLITLDTTRPDELGCYGSKNGLTPNLDALAQEGVLFETALAAAPMTTPSHASLLTGLYPFHHGVRVNGLYRLAEEQVTLAELLQAQGMATAAVLGAFILDHSFGLNQGFGTYDDDLSRGFRKSTSSYLERRADDVTQSALRWLTQHGDERFLLWIHYFDPHMPYDPPPAYATHGSDDLGLYQGEVAYVDVNVGKVLTALKEMGLYDETAVIVAGDHGEAFGEHGEFGHGLFMYDSTLRVPLIARLPNIEGFSVHRGRRVGGRVSLVDVAPTLVEITGVEPPRPVDGHSLVPYLAGEAEDPGWSIYAETAEGKLSRGWSQLSGLYSGHWKLILAPRPELYDLSTDPGEENNQAPGLPERAGALRSELVQLVSQPSAGAGSSRRDLDPQTIESLRSLGYLTGIPVPKEDLLQQVETDLVAACQTGRDPKDMVECSMLVNRGIRYLDQRRPDQALHLLQKAQRMGGEDVTLLRSLGEAYAQLGMYDSALVAHQKVLELAPDDAFTLNSLGVIYQATGDVSRAEEMFKRSITSFPTFFMQHLNLAMLYNDMREYARADSEFQVALELAPEAGGSKQEVRLSTAHSLYRRGDLVGARKMAEQALAADPRDGRARDLLRRLGAPRESALP